MGYDEGESCEQLLGHFIFV